MCNWVLASSKSLFSSSLEELLEENSRFVDRGALKTVKEKEDRCGVKARLQKVDGCFCSCFARENRSRGLSAFIFEKKAKETPINKIEVFFFHELFRLFFLSQFQKVIRTKKRAKMDEERYFG